MIDDLNKDGCQELLDLAGSIIKPEIKGVGMMKDLDGQIIRHLDSRELSKLSSLYKKILDLNNGDIEALVTSDRALLWMIESLEKRVEELEEKSSRGLFKNIFNFLERFFKF